MTGGRVARVVLHPLTISRTDVADNPHPLLVVWMGPIIGVVTPTLLWLCAALLRLRGTFVLRFFAGVCCVANGLYISLGSIDRIGDCGEMLRRGSPPWLLWLFGGVTVPFGFGLWHGQGRHFGLGKVKGNVDRRVAYGVFVATFVALLATILFGGR